MSVMKRPVVDVESRPMMKWIGLAAYSTARAGSKCEESGSNTSRCPSTCMRPNGSTIARYGRSSPIISVAMSWLLPRPPSAMSRASKVQSCARATVEAPSSPLARNVQRTSTEPLMRPTRITALPLPIRSEASDVLPEPILNCREVLRHESLQRCHFGVASDLGLPLVVIRLRQDLQRVVSIATRLALIPHLEIHEGIRSALIDARVLAKNGLVDGGCGFGLQGRVCHQGSEESAAECGADPYARAHVTPPAAKVPVRRVGYFYHWDLRSRVDRSRRARELYYTLPMAMGKHKRDRPPSIWAATTGF